MCWAKWETAGFSFDMFRSPRILTGMTRKPVEINPQPLRALLAGGQTRTYAVTLGYGRSHSAEGQLLPQPLRFCYQNKNCCVTQGVKFTRRVTQPKLSDLKVYWSLELCNSGGEFYPSSYTRIRVGRVLVESVDKCCLWILSGLLLGWSPHKGVRSPN